MLYVVIFHLVELVTLTVLGHIISCGIKKYSDSECLSTEPYDHIHCVGLSFGETSSAAGLVCVFALITSETFCQKTRGSLLKFETFQSKNCISNICKMFSTTMLKKS